jgi:predicted metal-dependent hydrolase
MPQKIIHIDGIGDVTVTRRKGARSLRLRLAHDGSVHVSAPYWTPYQAGVEFAKSRADWIRQHRPAQRSFGPDDGIGKQHVVRVAYLASVAEPSVRLKAQEISVKLPFGVDISADEVQAGIQKQAIKALRREALDYLPGRLDEIAAQHGFEYRDVRIRNMSSRWGSCTSHRDISLSLYLMQLDEVYIEYVILHELVHTRIMKHGAEFWNELDRYVPDLASIRKQMRAHRPGL